MTERTELQHLALTCGPTGTPTYHGNMLLVPKPGWATALVYGTNFKSLLWTDKPITEAVQNNIKAVDAYSGNRRAASYGACAGWRNAWIQPPAGEAPAHPAVFYACVVEDVDTPYGTLEEAKASAERHAKANPGARVTVMQEHGVVVATTKLDWS